MFYPATGHGTVWCFCRDCVSPDAQALVGEIIVQPEALVHEQHSCVHLAVGVTVGCQCTGYWRHFRRMASWGQRGTGNPQSIL